MKDGLIYATLWKQEGPLAGEGFYSIRCVVIYGVFASTATGDRTIFEVVKTIFAWTNDTCNVDICFTNFKS